MPKYTKQHFETVAYVLRTNLFSVVNFTVFYQSFAYLFLVSITYLVEDVSGFFVHNSCRAFCYNFDFVLILKPFLLSSRTIFSSYLLLKYKYNKMENKINIL